MSYCSFIAVEIFIVPLGHNFLWKENCGSLVPSFRSMWFGQFTGQICDFVTRVHKVQQKRGSPSLLELPRNVSPLATNYLVVAAFPLHYTSLIICQHYTTLRCEFPPLYVTQLPPQWGGSKLSPTGRRFLIAHSERSLRHVFSATSNATCAH